MLGYIKLREFYQKTDGRSTVPFVFIVCQWVNHNTGTNWMQRLQTRQQPDAKIAKPAPVAPSAPLQENFNLYHAKSHHIFALPVVYICSRHKIRYAPPFPLSRVPTFGGDRPLLDPNSRGNDSGRHLALSRDIQKEGQEGEKHRKWR